MKFSLSLYPGFTCLPKRNSGQWRNYLTRTSRNVGDPQITKETKLNLWLNTLSCFTGTGFTDAHGVLYNKKIVVWRNQGWRRACGCVIADYPMQRTDRRTITWQVGSGRYPLPLVPESQTSAATTSVITYFLSPIYLKLLVFW